MFVGVGAHQGLQHRGADLIRERYRADLGKAQLKLSLQHRIDRDDQRLDHVVEEMREADRAEDSKARACALCPRLRVSRQTILHGSRSELSTLLATCSAVLRECAHESLRAVCLSQGTGLALGRAGIHRGHRLDRIPRRDRARPVRAADPTRGLAALARSRPSAGVRGADHLPHARSAARFAGLHADVRNLGREERARGKTPGTHTRHFTVGADSRFHFHYKRIFPVARAGTRARGRIRGDLRHLHQPGLEHGVQLLSVAAHRPYRAHRGGGIVSSLALDAVLAARDAVRHACARVEHDAVDVGRLVLRGRLRVDHGRSFVGCAAGRRLLHRARHRAEESGRDRLGDRDHADRDPALRSAPLPAAGRLGRPIPGGAGARRAGAGFLGAHHDAPLAPHQDRLARVSQRWFSGPAAW